MSANFRPIFSALYNQYTQHPKTAIELWPLGIDNTDEIEPLTMDQIKERNRRIIQQYQKN